MRVLFTSTFFGISLLYANLHAKVLNECVSDTHRQRGCIEKMYWSTEIGESAIVGFQVPYHNGKREGLYQYFNESGNLDIEVLYKNDKKWFRNNHIVQIDEKALVLRHHIKMIKGMV